jgi:DNA-binding transcriptional MerR regulator
MKFHNCHLLVLQLQVLMLYLYPVTPFTLSSLHTPTNILDNIQNDCRGNRLIIHTHCTGIIRRRLNNTNRQSVVTKQVLLLQATINEDESSSTTETKTVMKVTSPEAELLKQQAKRVKLEAEKLEAQLTLEKIQTLQDALMSLNHNIDKNNNSNNNEQQQQEQEKQQQQQQKRKEVQKQIQTLVQKLDPSLLDSFPIGDMTSNDEILDQGNIQSVETNLYKSKSDAASAAKTSTPSTSTNIETNLYKNKTFLVQSQQETINETELQSAVEYFNSLPKPMKKALANAIDLDEERTNASIIVLGLYEFVGTGTLNSARLNKIYNDILLQSSSSPSSTTVTSSTTLDEALSMLKRNMNSDERLNDKQRLDNLNDNIQRLNEETNLETMVESFLPRVTRKEGKEPTLADVKMLQSCQILGKETFQMSSPPQKIPGGFILRGEMVPKLRGDCDKLIQLIDEQIESSKQMPPDWKEKFQVNIMYDPTPELFENEESIDGETVLVVHSRDMSPMTNRFLLSGVSALSLLLTFVFVIATYSQNEVVMQRLTSANAVGDYDATWFNELITPMLISIGVTQACHEAGHLFIAKKDGFKITPPTILPLVALPYLSFKQNIKTSPKNYASLFNFGMIGPALGMILSSIFFFIGLQLTLTMDASAMEYAPSVPVFFIKLSTLGGTIIDNVIGGGQGIITQQDLLTPVKLHPLAIGGFASLMINCLDTIPLPGTDGGRMSQSLLGRSGQVAFGGVVYFALLAYTVFSGHRDIFLALLVINSFARQDIEVPCRNEIDKAGLGQAAIALLMWSIAILALTPMD